MSIALEAKVEALEARIAELECLLAKTASQDSAQQLHDRIAALELARKPGPKPKDAANG
jgi:BMFP domain-containing protein YqiC